MKKFLFLLLAAATITACSDDDNKKPDTAPGTYTCALKVTDATTDELQNEAEGVICKITAEADKSFSLTMNDVKFTSNPREPVKTIVFKNLSTRFVEGVLTFASDDPIIPEIDNTPYKDYQISNFLCQMTDDTEKLHIVFTCINSNYHLNHTAEFNGTLIK